MHQPETGVTPSTAPPLVPAPAPEPAPPPAPVVWGSANAAASKIETRVQKIVDAVKHADPSIPRTCCTVDVSNGADLVRLLRAAQERVPPNVRVRVEQGSAFSFAQPIGKHPTSVSVVLTKLCAPLTLATRARQEVDYALLLQAPNELNKWRDAPVSPTAMVAATFWALFMLIMYAVVDMCFNAVTPRPLLVMWLVASIPAIVGYQMEEEDKRSIAHAIDEQSSEVTEWARRTLAAHGL